VVVAALRNPSLARALVAYFVFNAAEWGTWIAMLVYAFDRGGTSAAAVVAVVQLIPCALLAPLGATLGDRIRRDRALAIGYLVQAGTMTATAIALKATAPLPIVYALAAVTAVSVTLTRPVHLSALPGMSRTPEELSAANALSSTIEGLATFAGPALAGILLATSGPWLVFAAMAAGHVVGGTLVATTRVLVTEEEAFDTGSWHPAEVLEGFTELRFEPGAAYLIGLIGAEWVVLGMLDVLGVVLAFDLLELGPSGPGLMASAGGIGMLVGALATVALIGRSRLRPAVVAGALLAGVPLALVGVGRIAVAAFLLLAAAGAGRSVVDVAARTLLQRTVREDVQSRVFGLQEGLSSLALAIGSAAVPILVAALGASAAFVVAGALMPLIVVLGWRRLRGLDADERPYSSADLNLLRALPIFRPLAPPVMERLVGHLGRVKVVAGQRVIAEGEPGDLFYIVEEGGLSVAIGEREVGVVERGGSFGEIALLRSVPRTATVTALTPCRLLTLPREAFLEAVTGSRPSARAADRVIERHRSTA
jgi:MFS family permease